MGTQPLSPERGLWAKPPSQFLAHFHCGQTAGYTKYGARPQPRGLCVRWGHSPLPKNGRSPPIFGPCLSWPNGWIDQDGTWHGAGLVPGHIVLDGEPAPRPPNRGQNPPILGSFLWSPNGWMNQDGTWHGGGPWSKPHCTRWGPIPTPKKGQSPQFSAHFYCRQTAGWIKMALGMEAYPSPVDFVLDGDPVSLPLKGHSPPIFGQCPLWANDWMN